MITFHRGHNIPQRIAFLKVQIPDDIFIYFPVTRSNPRQLTGAGSDMHSDAYKRD